MNLVSPALLVLSLSSLAACGGGGGGTPPGDPATPDASSSGPSSGPDTPSSEGDVPETALEGVWESACLEAVPPAVMRRFVVQVTDNVFSFADTTYGDASCTEENALREVDTRGTFVERPFMDGQRPEDGIPIDLSIGEVLLIPRQSMAARRYNEQMLCGSTVWATNVMQDIEGCVDESGTIEANTTVGRTDFNVFFVAEGDLDVRADDTLLLGTVQSVTDPAQRPATVDPGLPFSRRPGSLARPL